MMHPEQVHQIIAAGLPCEHLQVSGDGHHFEALIVSAASSAGTGCSDSKRVNAGPAQHFDSGELHALSMKTQTPEEWGKRDTWISC
jgi:acid stress-induced BolA-like protein IbaG/YrbA